MDRSIWRIKDRILDLEPGVLVGVLNVTPDSFSDGGDYPSLDVATAAARSMYADGAHLVDVGGESTRPGAAPVDEDEEMRRVLPVIGALVEADIPLSVDTSKPGVAIAAIDAGASVVNDVTGFGDPEMVEAVADAGVGVVIMHMAGGPRTMQNAPHYDDVVTEVGHYLAGRAAVLVDAGVDEESIVIDPGFGFGKTPRHNLELVNRMDELVGLGFPVMLGASRKSTLEAVAGETEPKSRDGLTAVTTAMAYERGARIFRVHNVPSSRGALRIAAAIVDPKRWEEWQQA